MSERNHAVPAWIVGGYCLIEGSAFLILGLLHLGWDLGLGWVEPRIVPAALVETICGTLLAGAGAALLSRRPAARTSAATAQGAGICGILIGRVAHAIGPGASTPTSELFQWSLLVALLAGIGLALARPVRFRVRRPLSPARR